MSEGECLFPLTHLNAYSTKNLLFLSCRSGSEADAEATPANRVKTYSEMHPPGNPPRHLSPSTLMRVVLFQPFWSTTIDGMHPNGAETTGAETLDSEMRLNRQSIPSRLVQWQVSGAQLASVNCYRRDAFDP